MLTQSTKIPDFPKDIGDIVLCMGTEIPNIFRRNRYVVIHTPDIVTEEFDSGGFYWVMAIEEFKNRDVPMRAVSPADMKNPDNFSWVGIVRQNRIKPYEPRDEPGETRYY